MRYKFIILNTLRRAHTHIYIVAILNGTPISTNTKTFPYSNQIKIAIGSHTKKKKKSIGIILTPLILTTHSY